MEVYNEHITEPCIDAVYVIENNGLGKKESVCDFLS
jgi:hypothetical protein